MTALAPHLTAFLREEHPDLVVVSPLVDLMSVQVDVVRASHALGIPVALPVASWDNLTNKGLLRVEPDMVMVWNEAQKAEAVRYPGIAASRVAVTATTATTATRTVVCYSSQPTHCRVHWISGLVDHHRIKMYY